MVYYVSRNPSFHGSGFTTQAEILRLRSLLRSQILVFMEAGLLQQSQIFVALIKSELTSRNPSFHGSGFTTTMEERHT